jgi:hypothetical protein
MLVSGIEFDTDTDTGVGVGVGVKTMPDREGRKGDDLGSYSAQYEYLLQLLPFSSPSIEIESHLWILEAGVVPLILESLQSQLTLI